MDGMNTERGGEIGAKDRAEAPSRVLDPQATESGDAHARTAGANDGSARRLSIEQTTDGWIPNSKDDALLRFCAEVVAVLCYQPSIPQEHKADLVRKLEWLKARFSR